MNDFPELEGELKKLRPRAVSAELGARVRKELADTPTRAATAGVIKARRRIGWNWLPLGLGVAAAATFLILARIDVKQDAAPPRSVAIASPASAARNEGAFVPAGVTQVVYSTRDEGLQFPENAEMPMRRIRSRKRETLKWQNPQTGASLRVSYPSEEVVLTPISGQ